jgi:hypothetical protein
MRLRVRIYFKVCWYLSIRFEHASQVCMGKVVYLRVSFSIFVCLNSSFHVWPLLVTVSAVAKCLVPQIRGICLFAYACLSLQHALVFFAHVHHVYALLCHVRAHEHVSCMWIMLLQYVRKDVLTNHGRFVRVLPGRQTCFCATEYVHKIVPVVLQHAVHLRFQTVHTRHLHFVDTRFYVCVLGAVP